MPVNIAFYVHHHGSGHIMRAISISRSLQGCHVTFMGSRLQDYQELIPPHIRCIHLPLDVHETTDGQCFPGDLVDCLHYAPLNVKGLRDRSQMITNFFSRVHPLLLIVDVSVEVALLARLCSVPTIVIRQHGNRTDAAHTAAYQSAVALLAPYPDWMQTHETNWLTEKTIFTGGFSRYKLRSPIVSEHHTYQIAIMTGTGGTSINLEFIMHIASLCKHWTFAVIGMDIPVQENFPDNVIFYGHQQDPEGILKAAQIVIGNAGHNTVMEMATLNKRFIVIPEERPFDEQLEKASILEKFKLATVVKPEDMYDTNWLQLLYTTAKSNPNWLGTINPEAMQYAAAKITSVYHGIFK